jgi:hypothetical protein
MVSWLLEFSAATGRSNSDSNGILSMDKVSAELAVGEQAIEKPDLVVDDFSSVTF